MFTFYAFGDWGKNNQDFADSMASYGSPDFILALGDNFYPYGVQSVDDEAFQTSWSYPFLRHANLRRPWHVVLGNHDYMANPVAQVDFTFSKRNVGGFWQMPARNYTFQRGDVAFFALDTNGVQGHVRRDHKEQERQLFANIEWLDGELQKSRAKWKIVFGHHPMYTNGSEHGVLGRCLKDKTYSFQNKGQIVTCKGYGLEDVLVKHGVHAYLCGHEHVFQHKAARGVHHFVAGASVEYKFYGDMGLPVVDWYDDSGHTGFLIVEVSDVLCVKFVGKRPGEELKVIREVTIHSKS